jgi:hypothetical protein
MFTVKIIYCDWDAFSKNYTEREFPTAINADKCSAFFFGLMIICLLKLQWGIVENKFPEK